MVHFPKFVALLEPRWSMGPGGGLGAARQATPLFVNSTTGIYYTVTEPLFLGLEKISGIPKIFGFKLNFSFIYHQVYYGSFKEHLSYLVKIINLFCHIDFLQAK